MVDRKCPQAAAMEKEFLECAIFEVCDSKRGRKARAAIGELVSVKRGIVNQHGSPMMSSELGTSERV